jgi:hypothetical protein
MTDKRQTEGRKKNGALPLGEVPTKTRTEEVGRAEQRSAGPDGGDPRETDPSGSLGRH